MWPSWIRRQIVALKIVGSSPIIHPKKYAPLRGAYFLADDGTRKAGPSVAGVKNSPVGQRNRLEAQRSGFEAEAKKRPHRCWENCLRFFNTLRAFLSKAVGESIDAGTQSVGLWAGIYLILGISTVFAKIGQQPQQSLTDFGSHTDHNTFHLRTFFAKFQFFGKHIFYFCIVRVVQLVPTIQAKFCHGITPEIV